MRLREPTSAFLCRIGIGRIGTADEAVLVGDFWISVQIVPKSGKNDFRRKRQRRSHGPRRQRPVVRTVGHPSSTVAKEPARNPSYPTSRWPGAVARRDTPPMLAVAHKPARIPNRILLLNIGRPTAVLEVIDVVTSHEVILDPSEINPNMR